ncbi:MAG: C10 family peptidase [Flavobacterium sp.]
MTKIVNDPMFISLDNALKLAPRAEIFYSRENDDKNYTRISSTKKVAKSASITENGIPYFYVFNYKNGGWVIISSDKRMMPILAYSKTGTFNNEDIPIGLILWENATKQIIKDLRNSNSQIDNDAVLGEWNTMECIPDPLRIVGKTNNDCHSPDEFVSQIIVGPILTTAWGQDCGYNELCPTVASGPCGKAFTGCVATAMAQIIKYWQYPNGFNYANMPVNNGNTNVSQLMSAAGVSVNMSYGAESSSANTEDVDNAFRDTFSYSSASFIDYGSSSYMTVQNNIQNNQPVILAGCNNESNILGIPYKWQNCHAWVCDGFQQTNYVGYSYLMFHMNWGWSGYSNGWFQFNNWHISGVNKNYQYNQRAVINIHP